MGNDGSTFGKILTWLIVGVVAIVVLKIALGLVGVVLGSLWALAMLLLFKVVPLAILVWLGYKAWQLITRPASADPY